MSSYVIIGGGPAATNAFGAIREFDSSSPITLVSDEPAHSRMALPYWIAGNIPREHTYTGDESYFQQHKVTTRFGVRVDRIDSSGNLLDLSDGSQLGFDKLLIATGSSPASPPIPGSDLPGVQHLWSLANTEQLLQSTASLEQPRVVLVGAGFIGFIVLNAMFKRNWKLTVVEREGQVLPRMLDQAAATVVTQWLGKQGVDVHTGTTVQAIREEGGAKKVALENGTEIEADIVILATGIRPNLQLLDGSGIEVDQGIVVDRHMQTNHPHIFAAGDVAQGPVKFSDQNAIHAIQPTAVDHGRVAGANMAGQSIEYPGSLLMNVVDVCGLQTASFGNWDDDGAEAITISNAVDSVYRKMLWRVDRLVGAIFTGHARDLGMLTDVGMVKGILQSDTPLGPWKQYLCQNPFDVRRAYIGAGVAQKLVATTLLGRPMKDRQFHYGNAKPQPAVGQHHQVFVSSKSD